MSLDKTHGNILMDFYAKLLTPRQYEVLILYYNYDYSMQEIAEQLDISKSAVADIIKRSTDQLLEYEEKLQLVKLYEKRVRIYDDLLKLNDDKVLKYVNELMNIEREED